MCSTERFSAWGKNLAAPLIFVLTFAMVMQACQATAPPDYKHVKIDTNELINAAALGTGDVFEIRVYGHADMTGIYRVDARGGINFPLVGQVMVQGKTATAIAETLRTRLQDGYLRNPNVAVFIKEFNSKKVFVLGQVQKPGIFGFEEQMNIVQAVALAGGFTALAQKNYAIVKRIDAGTEVRIPVPVEKIITDKSPNFLLQPGDIVFIPEAVL